MFMKTASVSNLNASCF